MFLNSEQLAWSGILTAAAVLLIVLSGVIETSSLFFLAAASFVVGTAERKSGVLAGVGCAAASFLLGFILSPQKLYCLTFLMFAVYVLVEEYLIGRSVLSGKLVWLIKGILYHLLLIGAILTMQFFTGLEFLQRNTWLPTSAGAWILVAVVAAEVVWVVFDRVYCYFRGMFDGGGHSRRGQE